ncbi:TetR/AcrR family transcriptional regulator [Burkholderia latens]|uniref:TetR family transcriptional regulator n=1 Tax=Burkholderia latens TaxID=488446 RepID=A0A6P2IDY3_9BURK|nr:TetR/AcrR family transcriptional regulator [Burkholderia latens]VWB27675.1 TetR family transcriptional regulator [Burkholderia latens]
MFYANFGHKRELLIEILHRDRPQLLATMRPGAHELWSCRAAHDADIAAKWKSFPLWVEVHLHPLRDAALREIVDGLHAQPVPRATASGAPDAPQQHMPSSGEWAARLGIALLAAGAQHRDEPAQDTALAAPSTRAPGL